MNKIIYLFILFSTVGHTAGLQEAYAQRCLAEVQNYAGQRVAGLSFVKIAQTQWQFRLQMQDGTTCVCGITPGDQMCPDNDEHLSCRARSDWRRPAQVGCGAAARLTPDRPRPEGRYVRERSKREAGYPTYGGRYYYCPSCPGEYQPPYFKSTR